MSGLTLHRVGAWCLAHRVPLVPALMRALGLVLFSCVVPAGARIGAGTKLGYRGLGIVIHVRAHIGKGCLIGPHAVVGGTSGHHDVPRIGDRVFIGAGACILGPIVVGDGAVIGANAVVTKDVAPRTLVAGVPAIVIRQGINVDDYATMPELR